MNETMLDFRRLSQFTSYSITYLIQWAAHQNTIISQRSPIQVPTGRKGA